MLNHGRLRQIQGVEPITLTLVGFLYFARVLLSLDTICALLLVASFVVMSHRTCLQQLHRISS